MVNEEPGEPTVEAEGPPRLDPLTIGMRSFVEAGRVLLARLELLLPTLAATLVVTLCETAVFVALFQVEAITSPFGEGSLRTAGTLTFAVGGAVLVWIATGNLAMVPFRPIIGRRLERLLDSPAGSPPDSSRSTATAGITRRFDFRLAFVTLRGAALTVGLLTAGFAIAGNHPALLTVVGLAWFLSAGILLLDATLVGATPLTKSSRWVARAWWHRRLVGGYLFSHLLLSVIPLTLLFVVPMSALSGGLLAKRLGGQPDDGSL